MKASTFKRLFLLLPLACFGGSSIVSRAATCQDIAVPAYFYPSQPTSQWNTAVSDAPLPTGRVRVLIMNPANGPGTSINQDYVNAVQMVHAAGTNFLVYGYVYTSYGQRSLASVEADVNNYNSWYGVDGIFVDETASPRGSLQNRPSGVTSKPANGRCPEL